MTYDDNAVARFMVELWNSEDLWPDEYVHRVWQQFPNLKIEQFGKCLKTVYAEPEPTEHQWAALRAIEETLRETETRCLAELDEDGARLLSEKMAALPKDLSKN